VVRPHHPHGSRQRSQRRRYRLEDRDSQPQPASYRQSKIIQITVHNEKHKLLELKNFICLIERVLGGTYAYQKKYIGYREYHITA